MCVSRGRGVPSKLGNLLNFGLTEKRLMRNGEESQENLFLNLVFRFLRNHYINFKAGEHNPLRKISTQQ